MYDIKWGRRIEQMVIALCLFSWLYFTVYFNFSGRAPESDASVTLPTPPVTAIHVSNIQNGETLRYPVALISGRVDYAPSSVEATSEPLLFITNADNKQKHYLHAAVSDHKFILLTELVPGKNRLTLSVDSAKTEFTLNYRPATSPYKVIVVYLTPKDGSIGFPGYSPKSKQDYEEKFDTALKLMQTFTAEEMNRLGLGRKTFNLELDKRGKVIVHTERGPATQEEYRKQSANMGSALCETVDMWSEKREYFNNYHKVLVFPAVNGPGGGRGSGGRAIPQAPGLGRWCSTLNCVLEGESLDYYGGLDEMFVALHELGHCFDCQHSSNKLGVMSCGTNYGLIHAFIPDEKHNQSPVWEEYDAAHFYYLPFFSPDTPPTSHNDYHNISCDFNTQKQEVTVSARRGIGAIQIYHLSDSSDEAAPYFSARHALLYKQNQPKRVTISVKQIKEWMQTAKGIRIDVTDAEGTLREDTYFDF